MVESNGKRRFYFAAFVLPCLVLYLLFFITPFVRGIYISFTNWDGLTPKSPIVLKKAEFESDILGKLKKQSDKDYLLKIYEYNSADDSYHRIAMHSIERRRVESILRKAKWEPALNKFVGLSNYKKILTGGVEDDFYPHSYEQKKYNANSDLPTTITMKEFNSEVLAKCSSEEKDEMMAHYTLSDNVYKLNPTFDEFKIEDNIWNIDEVKKNPSIDIDSFLKKLEDISLTQNVEQKDAVVRDFCTKNALSEKSVMQVKDSALRVFYIGGFKNLLASKWIVKKHNMGVTGFTLFFAFFSVIGINLLAFLLALALDTKVRGQKVLRSIFFLPNVLSMIIVALIWSMLFVQLLPALTGIDKWISDPNKTPWLLVLVSVWQGCGYYMIIYLAGLQNIPTELIEAAKIDGASGWQRFKYITVPLLIPAFTVSLFLSIANALKSFDLIYAMIGSTGYATGTVPFVMDIYFDAFAQKQAGMATAKAMLLFFVIFLITGVQLIVMKRKEVEQ